MFHKVSGMVACKCRSYRAVKQVPFLYGPLDRPLEPVAFSLKPVDWSIVFVASPIEPVGYVFSINGICSSAHRTACLFHRICSSVYRTICSLYCFRSTVAQAYKVNTAYLQVPLVSSCVAAGILLMHFDGPFGRSMESDASFIGSVIRSIRLFV